MYCSVWVLGGCLQSDLDCTFPPSDGEGGVVGAIKNSEEATRACLSTIKSLLREQVDLKEKTSDAQAESAKWLTRERELKEDFRSMENKLMTTIDKKKSTIYMLEDDLGRLQADVDRLRAERNDLRDVLDEQRAGDASFGIVTKKLDAESDKNRELARQLAAAKDDLIGAEIQVEELKGELSEAVRKLRVAREEAEEALTRSSELGSENSALELALLAAQKELRK
jgi:chromosome segregation ATPase